MFNAAEIELLNDAIAQSLASNKRMQVSKPKFHSIFAQIETDLLALKVKIAQNSNTVAKK